MNDEQVARGLGWFSIGLGLAELLAPEKVGQAIGVKGYEKLIRGYGAREIASGLALLLDDDRTAEWLWSRVAGDAVDLGSIVAALQAGEAERKRAATALALVAGVTLVDVWCASRLTARNGDRESRDDGHAPLQKRSRAGTKRTRKVVTINRPAEELYQFWRNFENLPQFMNHLKSVTVQPDGRSHWVAKGPLNSDVEWDAEITSDAANEHISWRSLPGSTVENAGTVRFIPATGGRGTIVHVDLQYHVPGGTVGATIAKLFGQSPETQIPFDLMRLKQLLETGEIARTEGQPAGREHSTSRKFDDLLRK